MKLLKKIWVIISPVIKNKYLLTFILFVVWITFFDNNNLIDRIDSLKKLNQLEKDRDYYKDKIQSDSKRMNELQTNKENLEKFAREQYLMKRNNEDLFIVLDKKE